MDINLIIDKIWEIFQEILEEEGVWEELNGAFYLELSTDLKHIIIQYADYLDEGMIDILYNTSRRIFKLKEVKELLKNSNIESVIFENVKLYEK